jgi:hypothetical protein
MPARTYLVQFTETHGDTLPRDKWRKVMASSMENACVAGLRSEPAVKDLLASGSCWGWVQLTKFLHDNGTPMAVQSFHVTSKAQGD